MRMVVGIRTFKYVFNGPNALQMIVNTRTKGSFVAYDFADHRLIEFETWRLCPPRMRSIRRCIVGQPPSSLPRRTAR